MLEYEILSNKVHEYHIGRKVNFITPPKVASIPGLDKSTHGWWMMSSTVAVWARSFEEANYFDIKEGITDSELKNPLFG